MRRVAQEFEFKAAVARYFTGDIELELLGRVDGDFQLFGEQIAFRNLVFQYLETLFFFCM